MHFLPLDVDTIWPFMLLWDSGKESYDKDVIMECYLKDRTVHTTSNQAVHLITLKASRTYTWSTTHYFPVIDGLAVAGWAHFRHCWFSSQTRLRRKCKKILATSFATSSDRIVLVFKQRLSRDDDILRWQTGEYSRRSAGSQAVRTPNSWVRGSL